MQLRHALASPIARPARFYGHIVHAYIDHRLPRTVGAHVSLLVPHLGCKAYPIRSGIVNAIGHLIARGFEAPEEDSNAPGKATRCPVLDCNPRRWIKSSD